MKYHGHLSSSERDCVSKRSTDVEPVKGQPRAKRQDIFELQVPMTNSTLGPTLGGISVRV
ncbi:hypothetical protein M413DRAFT_444253, partial [Hebeloma cylindrosporum]